MITQRCCFGGILDISVAAGTSFGLGRFRDPVFGISRRSLACNMRAVIRAIVRVLDPVGLKFCCVRIGCAPGRRSRSARSCPRASSPA